MKEILWLVIFFAVLLWSGVGPKDRFTWFLEVLPAVVALGFLAGTRKIFPLTPLVYVLILAHSLILMVGGHYTYAEVPLFDRIAEMMGSSRNNYDKVGHFAQGFIPALVARELLLRHKVLTEGRWLFFIVTSICLAISAFYELLEWWVAELTGEDAEAFLGTQGYAWDTQSDMALAFLGAIMAQLVLKRLHQRQLETFTGAR